MTQEYICRGFFCSYLYVHKVNLCLCVSKADLGEFFRKCLAQGVTCSTSLIVTHSDATVFCFFFFFLPYHFFLHRLENRTKPISTPYDGRRWWDSNLRTPACKSPALPLCYGRRN